MNGGREWAVTMNGGREWAVTINEGWEVDRQNEWREASGQSY